MSWLLRAMTVPALLALAVGSGLLAGFLRGARAPMPSLLHGGLIPVPIVAVLALLPPVLAVAAWLRLPHASLAVGVRSWWRTAAALAAVPAVYATVSGLGGHAGAMLENARNAFGLLGLALLGVRLLGERGAVLAPVGYLLAGFLFGRRPAHQGPDLWAWALRDGGDLAAALIAAAFAVAGLAVCREIPRAQVTRGEA